jgi:hypothetical protein
MRVAFRSFVLFSWVSRIAVVRAIAIFILAQSVAGPFIQSSHAATGAQQTAPAPANAAAGAKASPASSLPPSLAPTCAPNADVAIPSNVTLQAKVTGPMDSGRLKVGKGFWVTVAQGMSYPGCNLTSGAAIYGHVTSATSKTDSNAAELSLAFDHADCEDSGKKEMRFLVIGLIGPSEQYARLHDDLPMGAINNRRTANTTAKALTFDDYKLNPGGAPDTVHPGIVLGLPKLKLDVEGGPGCSSSRISSTDRTAVLELGSELILVAQSTPK